MFLRKAPARINASEWPASVRDSGTGVYTS